MKSLWKKTDDGDEMVMRFGDLDLFVETEWVEASRSDLSDLPASWAVQTVESPTVVAMGRSETLDEAKLMAAYAAHRNCIKRGVTAMEIP